MIFMQNVNFISHVKNIFYHKGEDEIKPLSYEQKSEIKLIRQPKD
jgi:hypothetical protein